MLDCEPCFGSSVRIRAMSDFRILLKRIRLIIDHNYTRRYAAAVPLNASCTSASSAPIPYDDLQSLTFKPIAIGDQWGNNGEAAWFRFEGVIPKEWRGRQAGALIDVGSEAAVWKDGAPALGLTYKFEKPTQVIFNKRLVPLFESARGGEEIDILVDASAIGAFGARNSDDFRLRTAELVAFDREAMTLDHNLRVLENLLAALPENAVRRKRLARALDDVCNRYSVGRGAAECLAITSKLLASPAEPGALTAYAVGHAHLDLAWLWPIRETKRKGMRTFATALDLIDSYPSYVFGASQPQLYQWIKEDYPALYARIKDAVRKGKWECQGAMWVEADANVTSGESLVRQCVYGKRFFKNEFGVEVDHLWLPDVFGYSAALPQILRNCGVRYFMTQKISWNETNTFPHHTFTWEGIDGSSVLAHFLPANDYNGKCWPNQLIEAQNRYAQADVCDSFLYLYGAGDGGGGPSRRQIEFGLRQQDCEGAPRFAFSKAAAFFERIGAIPPERLPAWQGELYLELHRGTYTTQGLVKKANRRLEHALHDVEFLYALLPDAPVARIESIWKNVLLNQFHDIIPGSSINQVYQEAHALYDQCEKQSAELVSSALDALSGKIADKSDAYVIWNTLAWPRREIISIPAPDSNAGWVAFDHRGVELRSVCRGGMVQAEVNLPSMGYATIRLLSAGSQIYEDMAVTESSLENDLVKAVFADDGTLISLFHKPTQREMIVGKANRLLLWEDIPVAWDAWDINRYYRETIPEQARLVSREVVDNSPLRATVEQRFTIGNSTVTQKISLESESALLAFDTVVDWKEERKMLRVHANSSIRAPRAAFEIQFGALYRPTHENTSWDKARFEVCGHRFADVSEPTAGLALLNDCKYGYRVVDKSMELTLLRSPRYPDPEADRRVHQFSYAYYAHAGDLAHSDVVQTAHRFNAPVLIRGIDQSTEQSARSFFSVDGDHVKLETVKSADTGDGVIVRLYEMHGCTTSATIQVPWERYECWKTDMLEVNERKLEGDRGACTLTFTPWEIKTIRFEPAKKGAL